MKKKGAQGQRMRKPRWGRIQNSNSCGFEGSHVESWVESPQPITPNREQGNEKYVGKVAGSHDLNKEEGAYESYRLDAEDDAHLLPDDLPDDHQHLDAYQPPHAHLLPDALPDAHNQPDVHLLDYVDDLHVDYDLLLRYTGRQNSNISLDQDTADPHIKPRACCSTGSSLPAWRRDAEAALDRRGGQERPELRLGAPRGAQQRRSSIPRVPTQHLRETHGQVVEQPMGSVGEALSM